MAQMIFNKPSITVIEIYKANFDKNKEYLELQAKANVFDLNIEDPKI